MYLTVWLGWTLTFTFHKTHTYVNMYSHMAKNGLAIFKPEMNRTVFLGVTRMIVKIFQTLEMFQMIIVILLT